MGLREGFAPELRLRLLLLVYGDSSALHMSETRSLPATASPNAVTKLAAEHLVRLYTREHGMPPASLRLFTVSDPRQRPGMGFHSFILAALGGRPVEILGDGGQTGISRSYRIPSRGAKGGGAYNLGTGTSLLEVLEEIEEASGRRVERLTGPAPPGLVRDAVTETSLLDHDLGWTPGVSLREGIRRETGWIRAAYGL